MGFLRTQIAVFVNVVIQTVNYVTDRKQTTVIPALILTACCTTEHVYPPVPHILTGTADLESVWVCGFFHVIKYKMFFAKMNNNAGNLFKMLVGKELITTFEKDIKNICILHLPIFL